MMDEAFVDMDILCTSQGNFPPRTVQLRIRLVINAIPSDGRAPSPANPQVNHQQVPAYDNSGGRKRVPRPSKLFSGPKGVKLVHDYVEGRLRRQ